ncbi:MAG: ABC transporter ATP-binding protein [Candidatus Bathyarchaeia archaeon]
MVLEVDDLYAGYGDVIVLRGLDLYIQEGEIVTVVGSNGAGKTTLLKTIAGIIKPNRGRIKFCGQTINGLDPHEVVEKGIVWIPEGRKIFPTLSVLENLELGAYIKRAREKRRESLEKVFQIFPVLKARSQQMAGTLSGGEQQMLAIARGFMALPTLLMLDEPSLGLAPLVVKEIFNTLVQMNTEGMTVLLVEQNVFASMAICHRGYVVKNGKIVYQGTPRELMGNECIREAYLGM